MAARAWDGIVRAPEPFARSLARCGVAGARVLEVDWAATALGPLEAWPEHLRVATLTLLASGQPMAMWCGSELRTIHNDAFMPMLGLRAEDAMGKSFVDIWPDVYLDVLPLVRRALSGETVWMENLPLQMTRNGFVEETFWTFSYSPLRDGSGQVFGFLDVVTETTAAVNARAALERMNATLAAEIDKTREALAAREAAERQQKELHRELIHRMKNMLTILRAIISQSFRHAATAAEAETAIMGRIQSFANAQDVFTGANWRGAQLDRLVEASIEPYRDRPERFETSGPAISIDPQQSTWIALGLYELATNAVKYGALSTAQGVVAIDWRVEGDTFTLEWRERGGPGVATPLRASFGSRLTERVIPASLNGVASFDWRADGLVYRLEAPLPPPADDAPPAQARPASPAA